MAIIVIIYNAGCLYDTESPGRPSDVRVSNVTNTSAVLSWSPPVNDGGRPLSEIFYTVQIHGVSQQFCSYS